MGDAGIGESKRDLPKGAERAAVTAPSDDDPGKTRKAEDVVAEATGAAGRGASKALASQQLAAILGKLALRMAGDFRAVISVVFAAALAPASIARIEAATQAGKGYHQAAMKLRGYDTTDAGSLQRPHTRAWNDFARALLASAAECSRVREIPASCQKKQVTQYDLMDMATDAKHICVLRPAGQRAGDDDQDDPEELQALLLRIEQTERVVQELESGAQAEPAEDLPSTPRRTSKAPGVRKTIGKAKTPQRGGSTPQSPAKAGATPAAPPPRAPR
ncbi:unnamed protein product [Prorocentrum cordatum]|uniref:Uncharacterized protein n=1 Tax=Prorocentrum cordatum TaxID=2364126 RepID=A0ABN9QX20_9DINO|nr:unnamed protein product [Polarella glacialis]